MGQIKKIGFIGQGFVGKNYADAFVENGHEVVRYDLGEYKNNLEQIRGCSVVFVAVPTPTTPQGFDDSILQDALMQISDGSTVIIKSTVELGTTRRLSQIFPRLTIMHSPEFLREKSAAQDARHPDRNIIGILDEQDKNLQAQAKEIMSILPVAPYQLITRVENAELIKYAGNCFLYFKVVFMNMLYDLCSQNNLDYELIRQATAADPRIGASHTMISDQNGRGAGGHCLIKDFEVFINLLSQFNLAEQEKVATATRDYNLKLLRDSNKDLDLIAGVYGQ